MKLSKIKIALYQECSSITKQRVLKLKATLQDVQNAANNETKSSAGDKHETGRAMAQLETEKLSAQLSEALKLEQVLQQINPKQKHQTIGLGSLVISNNGNFYVSVSLGKIEIDNEIYFAISSASPIGQQLTGKKPTDSFSFNGTQYIIKELV